MTVLASSVFMRWNLRKFGGLGTLAPNMGKPTPTPPIEIVLSRGGTLRKK